MFDCHCDTLLKLTSENNLSSNSCDVDFKRLATYGKSVQMFAVFNKGNYRTADILSLIQRLKDEVNKSALSKVCISYDDISNNEKPVSALVSLEGVGNTPDFLYEDIYRFYDSGVRVMSITWNNDNVLCGGIEHNNKGLTELGRDTVNIMKKLGMVLDVSHISDIGFDDVSSIDGLRIMATHSNSRFVCDHNRNLTDSQFIRICELGGVVGLNTYPIFLNGTEKANVTDMIRHIEHFCSLGGETNIGFGADFDGIDIKMSDINSCEKMNILIDELAKLNYSDKVIRGIYCENLMNFYRKMKFVK